MGSKWFIQGVGYGYFLELDQNNKKGKKSELINRIHNQRRNVLRMPNTEMKAGSFLPVYPELQEKEIVAINQ